MKTFTQPLRRTHRKIALENHQEQTNRSAAKNTKRFLVFKTLACFVQDSSIFCSSSFEAYKKKIASAHKSLTSIEI